MERYSFFLPDHLREGLSQLKEREGIDVSEAIRQAIKQYLKREGIDVRISKGGARPRKRSK